MKIGPCKDEAFAHILSFLLSFVIFGTFYSAFEIGTNSPTEDAILLAVTISFLGVWETTDVQYYENIHKHAHRKAEGPGILINVKGRKYNPKEAAMAYCYRFHPMTSVFLRFWQPTDERLRKRRLTTTILGYVIEREELLAVLKFFGQCPEVPERYPPSIPCSEKIEPHWGRHIFRHDSFFEYISIYLAFLVWI